MSRPETGRKTHYRACHLCEAIYGGARCTPYGHRLTHVGCALHTK